MNKPLGRKAYGSIGHLPNSRLGPSDHSVHEGQARICTERARDGHDRIIVQEKLDGSCVAIARIADGIVALGRAGWPAETSPYDQHRWFARWVALHADRFRRLLDDGERVVGEWLLQAHGTRYELTHEPFVPFDIMEGEMRLPFEAFTARITGCGFTAPRLLSFGGPRSVEWVRLQLGASGHGALDPVEGAVWRVERKGVVDFLAKWVRPDKVDGCYLPEVSGGQAVWNLPPYSILGSSNTPTVTP